MQAIRNYDQVRKRDLLEHQMLNDLWRAAKEDGEVVSFIDLYPWNYIDYWHSILETMVFWN